MTTYLPSLATASAIFMAIHSELAVNVFDYLLGDPMGSELHVVSPEIRNEVILRLQRYAHGMDPDDGIRTGLHANLSAQLLLLRLGDERSIVEKMQEDRRLAEEAGKIDIEERILERSAQPLLIPYLARDFSREDGDEITYWSQGDLSFEYYPISAGSAFRAIGIVANSAAFNPVVRAWAEQPHRTMGYWR